MDCCCCCSCSFLPLDHYRYIIETESFERPLSSPFPSPFLFSFVFLPSVFGLGCVLNARSHKHEGAQEDGDKDEEERREAFGGTDDVTGICT